MTREEAKQILILYRSGAPETEDPSLAEALQLCEQDAELKVWFEAQSSFNGLMRNRFRQIRVPEGLQQQILAERQVHEQPTSSSPVVRRVFAGVLAAAAVAFLVITQWKHNSEDTGFPIFQRVMVGEALLSYGMDLNSESMEQIRSYLKQRGAISDFTLPPALEKAKVVGCVAKQWQGKPVSMICFRSGKPLPTGQSSDLWLFVTASSSMDREPKSPRPLLQQVNVASAASWSAGGKTYFLAIDGDQEMLKKYL